MKAKFRHSLLAAALALAALPAAVQASDSPFTKTIFFGDSLTDGGYFRPLLIQMVGPNGATIGQFTNNPNYVWSQYLADYYGSNAQAAWQHDRQPDPCQWQQLGRWRCAHRHQLRGRAWLHAVAGRPVRALPECRQYGGPERAVHRVGWCQRPVRSAGEPVAGPADHRCRGHRAGWPGGCTDQRGRAVHPGANLARPRPDARLACRWGGRHGAGHRADERLQQRAVQQPGFVEPGRVRHHQRQRQGLRRPAAAGRRVLAVLQPVVDRAWRLQLPVR